MLFRKTTMPITFLTLFLMFRHKTVSRQTFSGVNFLADTF
ncbi:hypothetical protein AB35_4618 [Escherichia coli 2-474-04_S1_C2]|nr:hypothetical protein AB35_4618 [Escherichia coli 2-474-04_S1_C2]